MRTQPVRLFAWSIAGLLVATLLFAVTVVRANVTITEFTATGSETDVAIFWHTESELDTLGFYVWRGEEPDSLDLLREGESEAVIISDLIPATGQTSPADYLFNDTSAEPNIVYYYYLQEIENSGTEVFVQGPVSGARTSSEDIGGVPTSTPPPPPTATPTASAATASPTPTATPATDTPTATVTATQPAEQPDVTPTTVPATPTPVAEDTGADDTGADDNSAETRPSPVPINTPPQDQTSEGYPAPPAATTTPASPTEDNGAAAGDSADEDTLITDESDLSNTAEVADLTGLDRAVIGASADGSNAELPPNTTDSDTSAANGTSSTRTVLLMLSAVVLVVVLIAAAGVVVILIRRSTV